MPAITERPEAICAHHSILFRRDQFQPVCVNTDPDHVRKLLGERYGLGKNDNRTTPAMP